jgi:error-prone DNA polymerase
MPDLPDAKAHAHPHARPRATRRAPMKHYDRCPTYAELAVTSNFTFLQGASHPDEYVHEAARLNCRAIAITDHNTLGGVVRAHVAAREVGIPLIVGCRLTFTEPDGLSLLVYPTDRASYGRLCTLLTLGKRRASKSECHLTLDDLLVHHEGLLGVLLPSTIGLNGVATEKSKENLCSPLLRLREAFDDDRLSVGVSRLYGSQDQARFAQGDALAQQLKVPLVAINDVYYHSTERRALQDVLTCVRHGCTISEAGFRLFPNGERYLKPPEEMARLFADRPDALTRTIEIADRASAFGLDQLRYEYAEETCPPGTTPLEHLKQLTWQGAKERYPRGVPDKVRRQIEHEFTLIAELNYAPYFLTVHDLVTFARSRGILCQGRGAAANSAVCYCLGVTSVDPDRIDLLFERFVSRERNEPPDIDIDFEHERREEVIQYIYEKYGRDRAGLTAEVITYRRRSAIRDVGKALDFSLDAVDRIAKRVDRWERNPFADSKLGDVPAQLAALGYDPSDTTIKLFVQLVRELLGFPRHRSQHVGGFVITRGPLCELVPIENAAMPDRTVIEWDKDDIDALGMLKVDVLGLGMLTAIRKALESVHSDEATKRRSHEDEKGPDHECAERRRVDYDGWKMGGGNGGQNVSRLDRMAESDGVGQTSLPSHVLHAGEREVWIDGANATCRGVHSLQHCGGTRPAKSSRLHPVSQDGPRLVDGVADPATPVRRPGIPPHLSGVERAPRRDGSSAPGADSKSGEAPALTTPSSLRGSVASSLSHSPSSLRPSVPACLSLATIPAEDPAVYDMLCRADTLGVFQVESRAQMTMLPRLKPRCFYDLVIEVAIVRPGPIVGDMVHPYLRRRNGEEPVRYPDETIRRVLGKTLGVPLFQEQVMALAIQAAGFTPGEAEKLRRAITAWTSKADIAEFPARFVGGMIRNGYTREFAEWCFERFKGFSQYGFPESHAASFALLVYASAWIKCYYPAVFAAALLNSQPMGFYAPAQIVRDAQEHGVTVRPVDVNHSQWDCTLEEATERRSDEATKIASRVASARADLQEGKNIDPIEHEGVVEQSRDRKGAEERSDEATERRSDEGRDKENGGCRETVGTNGRDKRALRLGLCMVHGLRRSDADAIVEAVNNFGPFASIFDLWRASEVSASSLRILAQADAFRSMGLDRQHALWEVQKLHGKPLPLFDGIPEYRNSEVNLPVVEPADDVTRDYCSVGLSLKAHPVSFLRPMLQSRRIITAAEAKDERRSPFGRFASVAGIVLFRQRPGTAKGVMFMTIEDETARLDLIVRPDVYERFRDAAVYAKLVIARGRIERRDSVVHLLAHSMEDIERLSEHLPRLSRDFR